MPPRSLDFRPCRPDDFDFLWTLRKQSLQDHVEQTWGRWEDAEQRRFFQQSLALGQPHLILVDGCNAGRLDVVRSPTENFLATIELLPEFQGCGLGSAVIRQLQAEAASAGIPVRLQVLKVNAAARKLYERLDFARIGETETHWLMAWTPAPT